jgi:eukaryotic-like serine/threonine-protein kinase
MIADTQGVVKVLDFGLASVAQASAPASGDPVNSPTLTISPTIAGMILGTAAYMPPEQARGKPVDKRADIWAFGCVLYEMLTGKQLFQGDDISEILAAVIKDQPDLSKAPPEVHRLLKGCLEKDPKKRLRDIGDAWKLLEAAPTAAQSSPSLPWIGRIGWIAAAVLALALGALVGLRFLRRPADPALLRFAVPAPENAQLGRQGSPAISPNGRSLAFIAGTVDHFQLWVRDLDSLSARPLAGTEGAQGPFGSPNSRSIAFFAGGKLKRVEVAGGAVLTLCDGGPSPSGSWGSRDVILFSRSLAGGLFSIPAVGGSATAVTTPETGSEITHRFPWFLPDGRHFLYASHPARLIYVADLDAPDRLKARREIPKLQRAMSVNSAAVYAPPGFLLFVRDRTLVAQPFDSDRGQVTGDAVPLVERLGRFSVSQNGVLAYGAPGFGGAVQLTWFDRAGTAVGTVGIPGGTNWPAISPDGGRVAHDAGDSQALSVDVWVHDLARGTESRFTFGPNISDFPVWSPDGSHLAFRTIGQGKSALTQRAVDGSGEQLLDDSPLDKRPDDWSRDGQYILEEVTDPKTNKDTPPPHHPTLPVSPFRRLLPFGLDEFFDVPLERRSHRRRPTNLFLQNKLALPARGNVLLDFLLLGL